MEAREGQVAVEVACNCEGMTLVADHALASWSCGKCRCKPRPTGRTVMLGVDGALPADWRDQPIHEGGAEPIIVEAVA